MTDEEPIDENRLGKEETKKFPSQAVGITVSTGSAPPTAPGVGVGPSGPMGGGWHSSVWKALLADIAANKVVPIIGRDLLEIVAPDTHQPENLYDYVARRLAAELGSTEGSGHSLNDVVCAWLTAGRRPEEIRATILEIVEETDPSHLPEPLLQLAEIKDFTLLVSTTFDDLLSRAVGSAYSRGEARAPIVRAFDLQAHQNSNVDDLDGSTAHRAMRPVVYHLMGKLRNTESNVVLTDYDLLEVMMALCSGREAQIPVHLLTALRSKHLLLLGVRFSDWLARFFLRMARQYPMANTGRGDSGLVEYVVDVPQDKNLVLYLEQFCKSARVYHGTENVVSFVSRLRRKWGEAYPDRVANIDRQRLVQRSRPASRAETPEGAIFISYSRDDQGIVERLVNQLGEFPVWYDCERLEIGGEWEQSIDEAIRKCRFFMPIISSSTNRRGDGYFWGEWHLALERLKPLPPEAAPENFLLPVIVDDLGRQQPRVPKAFLDFHMHTLRDGNADDVLLHRLRSLFANGRK